MGLGLDLWGQFSLSVSIAADRLSAGDGVHRLQIRQVDGERRCCTSTPEEDTTMPLISFTTSNNDPRRPVPLKEGGLYTYYTGENLT